MDYGEELRHAAERVTEAEGQVRQARADLRAVIRDAHSLGGMSLSAIGRELGITRQHVARLLEQGEARER